MPLLDRQVYPPRLTEAGEIVYRRALSMLAERDDLRAELDALRGLQRGVLRLGLPRLGSSSLFAPLFARFRSRYPRIEISLVEHGSRRRRDGDGGRDRASRHAASGARQLRLAAGGARTADRAYAGGSSARRRGRSRPRRTARHALHSVRDGFRVEPHHQDACQRAGFTPTVAARSRPTSSSPWSPPAWAWPSCRASRPTRKPTPASAACRCAIPAPIGKWCRSGGAAAIFHARRKPGWR